MRHPRRIWLASIGSLVVLDVWTSRNGVAGDSLSEVTRSIYRPETRLGRVAFVGSWVALSSWLIPHICKEI